MRSRSSRRRVPIRRSQVAFIRGAWTALTRIPVPVAWNTASNEAVKFEPRSRIRNLMSSNRSPRLRARLRACCTVHSPVGWAVTPPRCIRRVPCSINTSTYSLFSSTVSTCRKSTARIPAAWACRNCRQVGPARRGPDRCPRHAGSPTPWTARPSRRASSARRGSGGIPTADSPSPGERQGGRCSGLSAVGRACGACSCRTCPRPACGARPAASRASRGRFRSSACGVEARLARRTRPGRPAHTGSGRRGGAAPCSRAGVPAAQHLSPGPPEHQDGQAEHPANQQVDDLEQHPASQPSPRQACRR